VGVCLHGQESSGCHDDGGNAGADRGRCALGSGSLGGLTIIRGGHVGRRGGERRGRVGVGGGSHHQIRLTRRLLLQTVAKQAMDRLHTLRVHIALLNGHRRGRRRDDRGSIIHGGGNRHTVDRSFLFE